MITPTLILWLVALTFFPQGTQSCNGECPDGYRSVCVQRGSTCKCACVKDVAAGVRSLRELLSSYNVSDPAINEAEGRYRELAGRQSGEFSFDIFDEGTGSTWTIRGQGLAGTSTVIVDGVTSVDEVTSVEAVSSVNERPTQSVTTKRKKIRNTSMRLRTKRRVRKQSPKVVGFVLPQTFEPHTLTATPTTSPLT
jgi:hypothetical protein